MERNYSLAMIKEALSIFVSSRYFKTSGVKRVWSETERGTYKVTPGQKLLSSSTGYWKIMEQGSQGILSVRQEDRIHFETCYIYLFLGSS